MGFTGGAGDSHPSSPRVGDDGGGFTRGSFVTCGTSSGRGSHDGGGATAAALGQVAAVRILHAFPVDSYCCLLMDHCPRQLLQQSPEKIFIRPAKQRAIPKRVCVRTFVRKCN